MKFKYQDKVFVVEGFYRFRIGRVIDYTFSNFSSMYVYDVELEDKKIINEIKEDNLKKVTNK